MMKEYIQKIQKHLKEGTLQKMWTQTLWIGQYAKRKQCFFTHCLVLQEPVYLWYPV